MVPRSAADHCENIMIKGEIAQNKQFRLFATMLLTIFKVIIPNYSVFCLDDFSGIKATLAAHANCQLQIFP